MSNSRPQTRQNWGDNVFKGLRVGPKEPSLFIQFLNSNDFAPNSRRAITQDVRKFARWFADANQEPFIVSRVTTRDITDFKDHFRRDHLNRLTQLRVLSLRDTKVTDAGVEKLKQALPNCNIRQ